MITHNREYFYKYVSAKTAKAILENCSVRWSSPSLFNDPFDMQFNLSIPFSREQCLDAMEASMQKITRDGRKTPIQANNYAALYFNTLFDYFIAKQPEIDPKELSRQFRPAFSKLYEILQEKLPSYHDLTQKILSNACVFCISEEPESLLMWSHYADSHKGVLIRAVLGGVESGFSSGRECDSFR